MSAHNLISYAAIALAVLTSTGARAADEVAPMAQEPVPAQAEPPRPATPPDAANAPVATPAVPSARAIPVRFSRESMSGGRMKDEMDSLRVIRQADTGNFIGTQVAVNVGLALLTGGRAFAFQSFSKDGLVGVEPEGARNVRRLMNPALDTLPGEMERATTQWVANNPKAQGTVFRKPLVVSAATWKLVYNSLDGADPTYLLKLDVEIYKERETHRWPMPSRRPGQACSYSSEPRPLEAWRADDYQAVVDLAPVAVSFCVNHFLAQMPTLLELE